MYKIPIYCDPVLLVKVIHEATYGWIILVQIHHPPGPEWGLQAFLYGDMLALSWFSLHAEWYSQIQEGILVVTQPNILQYL